MAGSGESAGGSAGDTQSRKARLASALRANLKRRKAQTRARQATARETNEAPGADEPRGEGHGRKA